MKKYIGIISILIGLCLVCTGCDKQEQDTLQQQVVVPETSIEIEGNVVVEDTLLFSLDFPAFITEVHVKEGEKVGKGDVLVSLNLEDYLNQIEQKKNEIELYKLKLKETEEVLYPQKPHIDQLTKSIQLKENQLAEGTDVDIQKLINSKELAEGEVAKTLKDYEVIKELYEVGAASKEEVTQLERKMNTQTKQVEDLDLTIEQTRQTKELEIDALKAELKGLKMQIDNGKVQSSSAIDTLRLQIETATLQLENMESKLSKVYLVDSQIVSPSDDLIIQNISCQKGGRVELVQGALMEGIDTQTLAISANLPEEYTQELKIGDQVEVIPYTDQNEVLTGLVTRISENAVEHYGETVLKVTIQVEEDKGLLKVGGNVDVRIRN